MSIQGAFAIPRKAAHSLSLAASIREAETAARTKAEGRASMRRASPGKAGLRNQSENPGAM